MADLYLIMRIAGHRVAIGADQIDSVVEIDQITPVPRVAPHVAGLFALRSRVLTVIDGNVALGQRAVDRAAMLSAVIVGIDGHSYALLVEAVEDVVSDAVVGRCVGVLGERWSRIVTGQIEGQSSATAIPVVDPATLIVGMDAQAAA